MYYNIPYGFSFTLLITTHYTSLIQKIQIYTLNFYEQLLTFGICTSNVRVLMKAITMSI